MGVKLHAREVPPGWSVEARGVTVEGLHETKKSDVFRNDTGDLEVVVQHSNEAGISKVILRRSELHPLHSGDESDIIKEWQYLGHDEGEGQSTTAMRIADDLSDDPEVPWE